MGLAVILTVGAFISTGLGQQMNSSKPVADSLTDARIHDSLRQVINTGADLFNLESDYLGCYRLFQGSLIAVKPLLSVDVQTEVEAALKESEKMATFAEKANRLRTALDMVRDRTRTKNGAAPRELGPQKPVTPPAKTEPSPPRLPAK
jgi:hypothetical protein